MPAIDVLMSYPHVGQQRIARAFQREGALAEFLVPMDVTRAHRIASRLLGRQNRLSAALSQRSHNPRGCGVATVPALRWSVAVRLPHVPGRPPNLADFVDRAAARRLVRGRAQGVLALNGVGRNSMAVAHSRGLPAIVHVVDNAWDERAELLTEAEVGTDPALPALLDTSGAEQKLANMRAALRVSSLVLVQSPRMRAHVLAEGVPEDRVITIWNGVDTDRFSPRSGPRAPGPLRPLMVASVRGGGVRKGLPYAIAAVSAAGSTVAPLRVVGGRSRSEAGLRGRFPDSVDWAGEIHPLAMPGEFRHADVFVLPTFADSLARAVFEAMASGLPVITTANSGYGAVIDDGVNGFIVPVRDADAIATILRHLADDPALLERVGRAARATAERFTWDMFEDRIVREVVRRVVAHWGTAEPRPATRNA
ncbi:MAG: glycosyltransferase family 4 protein [Tepidiformaceae bacterium]